MAVAPDQGEETGGRKLRDDIPLNLGAEFKAEATILRNKLLMFRFKNFGKKQIDPTVTDRTIEPRLAQVFGPLLSVISDPVARDALLQLAKDYHKELIADRAMDMEAQILEVIRDLNARSTEDRITIKDITSLFASRHAEEYDRRITAKWIGSVIRRNLQLKTYKSNGSFTLAMNETHKLEKLFEKYGVAIETGTLGT